MVSSSSSLLLRSRRTLKTLNLLQTLNRFSTTSADGPLPLISTAAADNTTITADEPLPLISTAAADNATITTDEPPPLTSPVTAETTDEPSVLISTATNDTTIPLSMPPPSRPWRRPNLRRRLDEDPCELVCYLMAKRPWTTRMGKSLREILPSTLDTPLVLSILRRARSPLHALNFFRFAERRCHFQHDRDTYREIIHLLSRASKLNHARCILLDDIPARSPAVTRDESMFVPLIEAYGAAGITQESVKLFRTMPDLGVPRTLPSYEAFFRAILRRGRGMMAKRIFNSMLREGITPSVYTYNIMIWGFCLCEMMSTATRFFREMQEKGLEPDLVTYNTLISGWVRAKRMEDARKMFDEMPEKGLTRNAITYGTMIKGLVREDKEEALRVFREMEEAGVPPSGKTFSFLLPALCESAESAGEAKRLLEIMVRWGLRPKDEAVFSKLISSLCDAGKVEEAAGVLSLVDNFRLKVNSVYYNALVEGFCKAGAHDRAIDMVDEVMEKGVLSAPRSSVFDAASYGPIIAHMCANGLAKKAEDFFRLLMKKGVDDAVPFNDLIRGHSLEGSPESALELLAIMSRRGVMSDADALVSLVESFLRKGEAADAKAVLDTMMEHGHLPSSSLFRSVMENLFDGERVQTASRVMKSMIEKGVKDNMDVVDKILEELFTRGHVEEALGRINLMMENGCQPEFDRLLNALCEKNKVTSALRLADFGLERDCDIKFESFDRVLGALYAEGKTLNAYSLLCKITRRGHTNKEASAALVKALIDEGNTKQADILSRLIFPKETKVKAPAASPV